MRNDLLYSLARSTVILRLSLAPVSCLAKISRSITIDQVMKKQGGHCQFIGNSIFVTRFVTLTNYKTVASGEYEVLRNVLGA